MIILVIWLSLLQLNQVDSKTQIDIQKLFSEYLRKDVDLQPLLGTRLGDHRHSAKIESVSTVALVNLKSFHHDILAQLEDFKKSGLNLSMSDRIDLETWINHEKRWLWVTDNLQPMHTDPRVYNEYVSDSTFLLITQTTLPRQVVWNSVLQRTREVPRVLREAKANLLSSAKPKPSRVMVETAIRQNLGSMAWYRQGLIAQVGDYGPQDVLKKTCNDAVSAIEDYQQFLTEKLLPMSTGDWRIGSEKFGQKLKLDLESPLDADQVLDLANKEFGRVISEMTVLAKQLWPVLNPDHPEIPKNVSSNELIRQVIGALSKDKVPVAELVDEAKKASVDLKAFIRQKSILDLPNPDRCDIVEMPEFQRGNSVAYLNNAPPLDREARSIYAISPPPADWDARRVNTFLEEYNRRMMRILTLHEAYPGHYVQLEYANRNPSLIRKVLSSGVFIEGWAVHMEQVVLDEGFGQNDTGLKLLQLKWYLRAIGNALLDQGMHCKGWSDQTALKFLVDECFQSEAEAVGKIIRAKQSSCQLSTYFVGRMAFQELRENTQKRLGGRFDLKRYHHALLEFGSVPVKHLPELIRVKFPSD